TPPPTPCLAVLDFETDGNNVPLLEGTHIDNQWANYGVTITTDNNNGPDQAIIFNSSAPTGGDDDLGTPNQIYGGPGQGNGGISNNVAEGNLLIIAERLTDNNNDGRVDNPDDDANGGEIRFDFGPTATVDSITLIDVDDNTGWSAVGCLLWNGTVVSVPIPNTGDNGRVTIPIMQDSVIALKVNIGGSGGVAALYFCADGPAGPNTKDGVDFEIADMGHGAGGAMGTERDELFTAFPNPFHNQTTVRFSLAENDDVEIVIYDLAGKEIDRIFHDEVIGGRTYEVEFRPEGNIANGVFFARLITESGIRKDVKLFYNK
ncbi:MAG: T9SS type A sorting domain-containing protein, partial [Bacteroidota bacterium]